MPSGIARVLKFLISHWHIKLLAIFSAFALWFYVEIKNHVPFQTELTIENVPKGYEVFPKEVLITGRIVEKFYREEVLRCFKVYLKWDGKGKFATVEIKPPLPQPFVEIEGVYPQRVEVRKVNR